MNVVHFFIVVGIIFLTGYLLEKCFGKIYQHIEAKRKRKERRELYGRD